MQIELFMNYVSQLGVHTISGVPDSQLKVLCDYLNENKEMPFVHHVACNEGNAIGIAAGSYLATGKPAMVYMQNSGIGNIINPLASLTHADVYDIPVLLVVGWRGEPGIHDEPQHVFQGKVTIKLLEDMDVKTFEISKDSDEVSLSNMFKEIDQLLKDNMKVAIVVHKGCFEGNKTKYKNNYLFTRENAIACILKAIDSKDKVFSTTGKISREVYECANSILGNHKQMFLTVGSMGHTSMIAYGYACEKPQTRVWCMDGDGAVCMHMGGLAFLGNEKPSNMIHIVLNNEAHESVGGMPTSAVGISYSEIAKTCGYSFSIKVSSEEELIDALNVVKENHQLSMIEVLVALGSRDDLGRPKETPKENKEMFMGEN
ncbi:MAG: phosphonopyruvate decarboxylase [Erysipelotrichaceae bacterium]